MNNTVTLEKSALESKTRKKKEKSVSYFKAARKLVASPWRFALYKCIYRSESLASKIFAIVLLLLILLSSTAVILQTVPELKDSYHDTFRAVEWLVTILFTIEYVLRILALPKPWRYALSPSGILDFVAIFPIYFSLFSSVSINYLLVVRLIRLFRLFRVFNLVEYTDEAGILLTALKSSRHKITIFIMAVIILVTIIGSLIYIIEGPTHGFESIPKGIYWAIVTITTVGYGDVAPQTALGQTLASLLMLLGFSTIVVPTSIVSAEIAKHRDEKKVLDHKACLDCGMTGHDSNAFYCKYCGRRLWDTED